MRKVSLIVCTAALGAILPLPTKAEPSTVVVQATTPEGLPLAHVVVVVATSGPDRSFETDAEGRFSCTFDPKRSMAISCDAGFALTPGTELAEKRTLVIRPWGRIEGRLMRWGQPAVRQEILLTLGDPQLGHAWQETAKTDEQGRFVVRRVPPVAVNIYERVQHPPGTFFRIGRSDIASGDPTTIEIASRSRTVVGRFERQGTGVSDLDFSSSYTELMGQGGEAERERDLEINPDGSFIVELVEPGTYRLSDLHTRFGQPVALVGIRSVTIPDDAAAETTFDLGAISAEAYHDKVGDLAPEFGFTTLDGQPRQLADFRGRYVLLDFWATWCAPCIAENLNILAAFAAYGRDPRFQIISLSIDDDPGKPRRFVASRNLPWLQGFLGNPGQSAAARKYGIGAIPAIFLLGPDGRIIATGLLGPEIKRAVGQALPPAESPR